MLSVHKVMLAFGLFLLGVGISLFAVGGSGIATNVVVRGNLRNVRDFLFFLVVGMAAMGLGSVIAAYSFGEKTSPGSNSASSNSPRSGSPTYGSRWSP